MSKPFLEVFPNLKLQEDMAALMGQTKVERVAATKSRDSLRIYILSDRLILKPTLWEVEKQIKKQLFPQNDVSVKILEKFHLSRAFNAEKLWGVYKESFLEEAKHHSVVIYDLFKKADFDFSQEGKMTVIIDDTVFGRGYEKELLDILHKVFNERCNLDVIVDIGYKEKILKRRNDLEFVPRAVSAEPVNDRQGEEKGDDNKASASKEEGTHSGNRRDSRLGRGKGNRDDAPRNRRPLKRSDDPDVIYGSDIEEDAIPISDIIGELGEVVIRGQILAIDSHPIKNERTIVSFQTTDFTDTITTKLFVQNDNMDELMSGLKEGSFVKIKGLAAMDTWDKELSIGSVRGIKKIQDFRVSRVDRAEKKRVELHCHTKMSDMDGITDVKDIVKQAYKWGHPAIAVTDHGVVQAFPDANHVWEDLWKAEKGKRKEAGDPNPDKFDFFKIIYGVEGYLVDDEQTTVVNPGRQDFNDPYVVFDIETTGFSPIEDRIIEIGAVKVEKGEIVDRFSTFVNPEVPIPFKIEQLTSIRDDMVVDSPTIEVILPRFLAFAQGCVLVAHNAQFDMSFIIENCKRQGLPHDFTYADTLGMARMLLPDQAKHTLDAVAKTLNISLEHHHRAVDDAETTAIMFTKFIPMLEEKGIHNLQELFDSSVSNPALVQKARNVYHVIILAKNNTGRINLYRLVSESHLTYFGNRRPRIPKSLLKKYREGLIIGSACEQGELYRALINSKRDRRKTDDAIARIVEFYDYLEIQPWENNRFMIKSEDFPEINTKEDVLAVNKEIVKLGEKFHKPVVATCDAHFLNPEDVIYRQIILASQGFEDADEATPLYLRTTDEMLEEFSYLGMEKAEEVVITNTNLIADMIDTMSPVRPDKCPPVIPNSDEMLTKICYDRAHELYGPDLPEIVTERLERELHSIISNGFAVMYIIAQKLVWKSVEDGYLVGSRGSVGSSFVATMAGITEVNPLSPHYYCTECHYVDFYSDEVKAYAGRAGIDMPDKVCPVCGAPLKKDGFDIPFETFLGFKGDKEPDIDLNFSGEYQSKAHKYTEVIFGYGQTFRAGTIASVAEKTAYGYVLKYNEERGLNKRRGEVDRISKGCVGVRRSTGQHPGGIVVLPVGEEINSFTPVQHPANDMTTSTITTHFDYHSIDHNLLKLDILGHDDPTMIRMLQDLTGLDPVKDIPLDGQDVMSLFQNTEALGITPEDIGGCKLGALGIPEFGTDFAMQMLIDTQPKAFSDLVRIAGLAHGTDVWLGNAETLIKEGKATISTAICTRDDIMTYLISKGVESEKSFKIMEAVRKGKVAGGKVEQWPAWKEDMIAHDVPDWYIWSCEKIKYMFPKAHAAAYVMMAWRIAYCKVHYPLAYYSAYFSIRAKAFNYALMCMGRDQLEENLAAYKKRKKDADDKVPGVTPLGNKEQDQLADMRVVQEMYARGFEFEPIDIFRVKAKHFQIVDGKVMPSLTSIDGIGESAADSIVEGAKGGPFLSRDDFMARCKVGKTVAELLFNLG
ncbi:MAG: PolC-type DNA polymerase III, partial [Lachnospiraceae bacterium]|nr:PolC-type DNA polymerase III [Lachnospiraceae bacterium]